MVTAEKEKEKEIEKRIREVVRTQSVEMEDMTRYNHH
jgi:uncharacterized protein (DUF305 family)